MKDEYEHCIQTQIAKFIERHGLGNAERSESEVSKSTARRAIQHALKKCSIHKLDAECQATLKTIRQK